MFLWALYFQAILLFDIYAESLRIGPDIDLYTGPRNDGARILPCRQKAPRHGWFTPMLKVRPSAAEPRVDPPAYLSENRRDLIQSSLTKYLQRSKIYCQTRVDAKRDLAKVALNDSAFRKSGTCSMFKLASDCFQSMELSKLRTPGKDYE